ncbi:phosphoadenosine phosphosulfate reductase [Pelagibaculum spongiae]|nr:phosphoadenosine phosphosulfate reductase [Pelagibaculum spongiae]
MNEVLELQTGQVAFISSLMAGFAVSIAVQIIRGYTSGRVADICILNFILTALLFLVALYIDVTLILRLVGVTEFSDALLTSISHIRSIGTSAATLAVFLFIASIGLMGWLQDRLVGILSTSFALIAFVLMWYSRSLITGLAI